MTHIYTTPTTTQTLCLEIKLEDIHSLRVGDFTPQLVDSLCLTRAWIGLVIAGIQLGLEF